VAKLSPRPALVFIGFMGAGKSTALAAAREAGLETTEVDELIEREVGAPIGEFFDREGEAEFRRREAEVVVPLLERADGGAIAVGGGSVLAEGVPEALERHVVVWLQVDVEEAWRRVKGSDRPLARDRAAFEALMPSRQPLYETLADAVLPSAGRSVAARAMPSLLALVDELPNATRMVWAASASGEYPIFVGEGLLDGGYWPLQGNRFCVTDTTVAGIYAQRLAPLAGQVAIEPGEGAKTLAEAERVLRELAALGMTRSDHIAALGGGVVGDLAGFCAATYQRGVPVVQVPTTLVAQVDSAIGGKTGVDIPEAKNYVGAYHLPSAVLADTATLATLPEQELAAGWVEVLKTALLAGGSLWARVREQQAPGGDLGEFVYACARFKAEVVAADERDSGRRAILNLGHTVGHAIEAATGYERYRHGEAVGLGLLAALRLSDAGELREEVLGMLEAAKLPTRVEGADADAIADAVQRDKKRDAEGVRFVLLSEPGDPHEGQLVEPGRVREAIVELIG